MFTRLRTIRLGLVTAVVAAEPLSEAAFSGRAVDDCSLAGIGFDGEGGFAVAEEVAFGLGMFACSCRDKQAHVNLTFCVQYSVK